MNLHRTGQLWLTLILGVIFWVGCSAPLPTSTPIPATATTVPPTATPTLTLTPKPTPRGGGSGKIVYALSTGTNNLNIFVMDADGSNARQLTNLPGSNLYPSWSPDGIRDERRRIESNAPHT